MKNKIRYPCVSLLLNWDEDKFSQSEKDWLRERALGGAGVVTTRNDVHYVVTEYGVASLHGKTVRQRATELIKIAHPKFRDELKRSAKELGYL